jgi:hypothetical protein
MARTIAMLGLYALLNGTDIFTFRDSNGFEKPSMARRRAVLPSEYAITCDGSGDRVELFGLLEQNALI